MAYDDEYHYSVPGSQIPGTSTKDPYKTGKGGENVEKGTCSPPGSGVSGGLEVPVKAGDWNGRV